jgi:hypothetical protein
VGVGWVGTSAVPITPVRVFQADGVAWPSGVVVVARMTRSATSRICVRLTGVRTRVVLTTKGAVSISTIRPDERLRLTSPRAFARSTMAIIDST